MSPFLTPQQRVVVRLVTTALANGHTSLEEAAELVVTVLEDKGILDLDAVTVPDAEEAAA